MRLGRSTVQFENPPSIIQTTAIAGKKEGEGPLCGDFDLILEDDRFGEDSWEKAESKLQLEAAKRTLDKAGLTDNDIDYTGGSPVSQDELMEEDENLNPNNDTNPDIVSMSGDFVVQYDTNSDTAFELKVIDIDSNYKIKGLF